MLPHNTYTMTFPDVLADTQGVRRLVNKVGKEALNQELIKHHQKRIPLHFDANNRDKYQHMPRKAGYKARKLKKFHSRTDLVASGRTRDAMRRMRSISIGGTTTGATGLRGTLTLRFPFTQATDFQASQKKRYSKRVEDRKPAVVGVTIDQMRKEISTITEAEQKEMTAAIGDSYAKGLQKELESRPRLKKHFK